MMSYSLEANRWTSHSDLDLLQAVSGGDSEALGALYDRYGRLVFSLAYHITGDDGQAEEITQDVFVQVWNKALTYQSGRGKVSTWLTSVARHRAIDRLRRTDSRPEGRQVALDDGASSDLPDDLLVESEVELQMERKAIRHAVAQLPVEQQEALALAFFKGYSHQEIADETGEALGTVKTRIRLAMKKLRDALSVELR